MGKKKNKVQKLTEQEYYAYIAGLKNEEAAFFGPDGKLIIPDAFKSDIDGAGKHD